jgi:hypothetical protein
MKRKTNDFNGDDKSVGSEIFEASNEKERLPTESAI